ncbi:hypothetical protein K435DRAFT_706785, partial [Dendrothele bispora CBS 962.96]
GVDALHIDGRMSYEQRAQVVTDFVRNPNSPRVLVFSQVANVGLNLTIADIVIFFDQPWSGQEERQIIGRAHRQPQRRTVKVIHILANDSTDILMSSMAKGKSAMFEAFIQKQDGQGKYYHLSVNAQSYPHIISHRRV